VAVSHSVDLPGWRAVWDDLFACVAGRFGRVEPRRAAHDFAFGLLSSVERKNSWWLAEHAGYANPLALQRLLHRAVWDADAVRNDLRARVVDQLGHRDSILVPDETGFIKKGVHSAGVQRQYSGTAGRIENSQIAVFVAYVTPRGRALIDRRLYLPETTWCHDPDRRDQAGIPAEVDFATKPRLALQMLNAALDAGVKARWVTADEVYGNDGAFRTALEQRGLGYVLAVSCDHRVHAYSRTRRADEVAAMLPKRPWQTRSAGPGAKGHRDYDWAWIRLADRRWLLIRHNSTTGELAYYRCWSPNPVPLSTVVRVAGSRWAIEELFQTGKGQVGLDHYQVRTWKSWHRFITLALLALAFLTIVTASQHHPATTSHTHQQQPIPLTSNEIRHLIAALLIPTPTQPMHLLAWSIWRRTSQAHARRAHYQRRHSATEP
jgi:SRSO17 transposase